MEEEGKETGREGRRGGREGGRAGGEGGRGGGSRGRGRVREQRAGYDSKEKVPKPGREKDEERGRGQCALFISKRGRYCRMAATRRSIYCGEHLNLDPSKEELGPHLRILCPLDPHQ